MKQTKSVVELLAISEQKATLLNNCTMRLRAAREHLKAMQKEWEEANLAHERARAEWRIAHDKELE